ncbi:MAG: hypothetical protein A2X49_01420 [Lentisphaerae bacterium GWF2_52_8]|nr:MAG: hypothetical protein A2X49_01420 [Lentisphaerae bacterium GWF2_52_8]
MREIRYLKYSFLFLSLLFALPLFSAERTWLEASPLITIYEDTETPPQSLWLRFMGPAGEVSLSPDAKENAFAFRPLWSMEQRPGLHAQDFIWPLGVWRDAWYVKFCWFVLFYHAEDKGSDGWRTHLIPIWFSGSKPEQGFYWGLFPVYGNLYDFIGYDYVNFIVFPCYWYAEKNGTKGEGYLWPIVNWDNGPRSDKMRVFPFYAYNHLFGEFYTESYLWPIFHRSRSENPDIPGKGWLFWPLLGHTEWKDTSAWSFVWPFFQVSHRGDDGFGLNCPWPIFQYAKNMSKNGNYKLMILPFWGQTETQDNSSRYVLWPLGTWTQDRGGDKTTEWLWALPLYWTKSVCDKEGKRTELYRRFWPFASYYEDPKETDLRVLDIWPQRNMPAIERNWSPLWILFRYRETGDSAMWDLFWGLVRHTASPKEGEMYSWAGFYKVAYQLPAPLENAEAPVESPASYPVTTRDFAGGFLRLSTMNDGELRWRICWCLEF